MRSVALELERSSGGGGIGPWRGFVAGGDAERASARGQPPPLGVPLSVQLGCYGCAAPCRAAAAAGGAGEAVADANTEVADDDDVVPRYTAHLDALPTLTLALAAAWKEMMTTTEGVSVATGEPSQQRGALSGLAAAAADAIARPGMCAREVTAILYLGLGDEEDHHRNHGGDAARTSALGAGPCHDGALVLHVAATSAPFAAVPLPAATAARASGAGRRETREVAVAPVGGRLVLFDARSILHEVRPHSRRGAERLALTVWIGGAHSGGGSGPLLGALRCLRPLLELGVPVEAFREAEEDEG